MSVTSSTPLTSGNRKQLIITTKVPAKGVDEEV